MSKTKRILSFLLTVVMVFSMTSVGVNAYYSAYKDSSIINQYNGVDQPVLTTEQYASMILDEVDRLLAEENPIISEEIYNQQFYLDFSSIDKAFDSIRTNWDIASVLITMLGDIKDLNVDAVSGDGAPRRADDKSSDVDVIKAIIKFLKDNINIFKKAVIDSDSPDALDFGIFGDYLDLEFDIPNMIKGVVYKLAFDEKAPKVVTETMDEMFQIIFEKTIKGDLDPETGEYTGLLHELAGEVDLENTSFYELVDKAFRVLFNDKVNKFLDEPVREWVTGCVSDDPSLELLINTEYVVPTVDFNTWGNGETVFDHFNDLLGSFFESLAKPALGLTWDYSRGNSGLFDNLVNATKKVFGETGGAFFLDPIDPAAFPNTDAGNKQFLAYIVRSLINTFVDYINIPADMDTVVEVANYALRELAVNYIPSQYNEYMEMDLADTDTTFEIGADFAVYLISQTVDLELDNDNIYELDFDGTLQAVINWFLKYYGGLVASSSGTGWARVNSIVFQAIDASWLPLDSKGHLRNDLETLIKDDIVGNLFDLDLKAVLDLFSKNPTGELNQSATYIFVSVFKNILNMIFGSGTASQCANFETLLKADSAGDPLPSLVENIINSLYSRSTDNALLSALLPLVCSAFKLSTPQEFEYPYVSLGNTIRGATSFYVYNASSGINTAAKDAKNKLNQDQLYKYMITSVSTNQPGVTVKYNGSAVSNLIVNCGKSVYLNIGGTFTNNSLLIITLNYNIIGEDGSAVSNSPIEQKLYTYVTNSVEDTEHTIDVEGVDASGNVLDDTKNRHKASYSDVTYINSYVSEDDETPAATRTKIISELLDVKFTLSRKATDDEISHTKDATITLESASVNPALAAAGVSADSSLILNTTMNGGHWNVSPYAVADGATLPADGVYNSTFSYLCSPTKGKVSESLPFSHYVVLYNDADLPSLVSSAIKANRQSYNYDQTNKVYTYEIEKSGQKETLATTGPEAWANYCTALENAIKKVYTPKIYSNFTDPSFITAYASLSDSLKEAVTALEACVNQGAGSISELKDTVDAVVPSNIDYSVDPEIDPETGEETYTYYNYYDSEYRFFGMCDFVPYTYHRFINEKKAADKLINSKETIDAATLAYTAYKFNLYAGRLLKVAADKTALLATVNEIGSIAERGSYSQESWDKYVIAKDFANSVAAMDADDEDLRQSLVNTAKGELILAYKTLVENADYTLLNNAIANAAFILDASEDQYTSASWAVFANAKNEALSLSRELAKTAENQSLIESTAAALNNAVAGLVLKAVYTALNTALDRAMTYSDASLYPADLWSDFETALAAANGLSLDLDSSQQAVVDKAVSDLNQAIDALDSLKELHDDSKFYINDVAIPAYYGLIKYEGDYYYIKDNGRIVKSKIIYISTTNGLTFSDGTPIPHGFYEFDADGKLVFRNGIQEDGRYYINGVSVPSYYGLVEWEGNLYYIKDNAQIVRSKSCYINTTNDLNLPNGKPVQHAYYDFDADGKLMMKQGVQANGKYYIDDVAVPSYYGLVEWEGDFYYIKDNAQTVRSKTCYVNTTNGLTFPNGTPVPKGNYDFDADGKMIVKQGVQEDGKYYIYGVAVGSYYGLVEDGGYYYYVKDNAQIVRGKTIRINTTNGLTFPDGTPIPKGSYTFDADGRMVY